METAACLSFAYGPSQVQRASLSQMRQLRRFTAIAAIATVVSTMLLTAVPARATFPGKNGRIAFRRYLNDAHTRAAIFTINPDGTGLLQLTHPRRGVAHEVPDWSPDGKWIAYERDWGACCPETHPDISSASAPTALVGRTSPNPIARHCPRRYPRTRAMRSPSPRGHPTGSGSLSSGNFD